MGRVDGGEIPQLHAGDDGCMGAEDNKTKSKWLPDPAIVHFTKKSPTMGSVGEEKGFSGQSNPFALSSARR